MSWPKDWKTRKLYVVADGTDPDSDYWTISLYPDREGWETDSGYEGYGLPKEVAEHLVALHNAKLVRVHTSEFTCWCAPDVLPGGVLVHFDRDGVGHG